MKKLVTKILALSTLIGAIALPAARALPIVTVNNGPGDPGGLFNVVTSANGSFSTFCVERSETLSLGGTYYYTLNTSTQLSNDPISLATAWLFRNYTTAVTGYVNDAAHNNAIQNAFWSFENDSYTSDALFTAYVSATTAAVGAGNMGTNANGAWGVYAMNLWDDPRGRTGPHQDLLIHVPDGGLTVALLGIAFASFAWFSRKHSRLAL